ncbi:MAG TPA: VWA domain-containing protein [Vicinamibacterales bacterium]|jgi:VWFA-related protein
MKYRMLALSCAAASLLAPTAWAQTKDIQLYASAVDAKGEPVKGLGPSDFQVREDGVAREVLKAAPATEPLTIALLVDDSQASSRSIQMIRDGVQNFITSMAGKAEISLTTFGERPTIVTPYTTDQKMLSDGVKHIFPRPGSGAYLLEAIHDVSNGLEKRHPARPVIVVLMVEDREFSNLYYQQVLDTIDKSGATIDVVALGQPLGPVSDENRNRDLVVAQGTERTGGLRDQVLAMSGIPGQMTLLASQLAGQYAITYARPEQLIPPKAIAVTVTKPGVTVRARTRTAQAGAR